jgi:hypothetical protein
VDGPAGRSPTAALLHSLVQLGRPQDQSRSPLLFAGRINVKACTYIHGFVVEKSGAHRDEEIKEQPIGFEAARMRNDTKS